MGQAHYFIRPPLSVLVLSWISQNFVLWLISVKSYGGKPLRGGSVRRVNEVQQEIAFLDQADCFIVAYCFVLFVLSQFFIKWFLICETQLYP